MAEDPSNDISWLLQIRQEHLDYLGPIRHWTTLAIAATDEYCWVRGLTPEQLDAPEIRSIPFKQLFYQKNGRLFPAGSLVPVNKLSPALEWTSLEKGLPMSLPAFNHNFFGITEKLQPRLIPSGKEMEPAALLTPLDRLGPYMRSAPAARLKPLSWLKIDDQALLLGQPLLPLPGESYWLSGNSLLPAGLDWELPALTPVLEQKLTDDGGSLLLWDKHSRYLVLNSDQFRPLSISSFRLSTTGRTLPQIDGHAEL